LKWSPRARRAEFIAEAGKSASISRREQALLNLPRRPAFERSEA